MRVVIAHRSDLRTVRRPTTGDLATGACWAMVASIAAWSVRGGVSAGLPAIAGGALLLFVFWGRPRLAFLVWMLSIVLLPVWIEFHVLAATVPVHCLVATIAVAATVSRTRARLTKFDAYFALFLAVSLAAVLLAGSLPPSWAQMVIRWAIPFLAARVLVSATGTRFAVDVIAVLFGLVGALAVLELLLTWHPFVGWNPVWDPDSIDYRIWSPIQVRNGVDRSEWAFGHSIALGGSLALSIPFLARSSYSLLIKAALLIAVSAGIAVTASRGALAAAGLTAAICLLYVTKRRIVR